MNIFANFFKSLKKPFEDSSAEYKNSAVKQLNYIYLCACGFLQLKVNKTIKYTWKLWNLLTPIIMHIPMESYFIILGQKMTAEDIITLQVGISIASMTIFTQLSVHFFSKRILDLFKILDKDSFTEFNNGIIRQLNNLANKRITFSTILRIYLFCIGFIIASWTLNFITILSQSEHYGVPEFYFFPFPGVNKITSSAVFSFIYFGQCMILLTMQLSIFQNLSSLDLLTKNLSNEFQILYENLRTNNEQFRKKLQLIEQMERENENHTGAELNSLFLWQKRERMLRFCKEFNYNLIWCIRCHQKLMK